MYFIVDDSCSCCNTNVELILQTRCEVSKVQRTNETGKQNAKLSSKNENDSVILKMQCYCVNRDVNINVICHCPTLLSDDGARFFVVVPTYTYAFIYQSFLLFLAYSCPLFDQKHLSLKRRIKKYIVFCV